jgi:hypothetical protein
MLKFIALVLTSLLTSGIFRNSQNILFALDTNPRAGVSYHTQTFFVLILKALHKTF